jgi:hypothetical protein
VVFNCIEEWQAHDVGSSPQENRGGTAGGVGAGDVFNVCDSRKITKVAEGLCPNCRDTTSSLLILGQPESLHRQFAVGEIAFAAPIGKQ